MAEQVKKRFIRLTSFSESGFPFFCILKIYDDIRFIEQIEICTNIAISPSILKIQTTFWKSQDKAFSMMSKLEYCFKSVHEKMPHGSKMI